MGPLSRAQIEQFKAYGVLLLPGFVDAAQLESYRAHACMGRRWDDVDDQMRSADPRFEVPDDLFRDWGPEVSGVSQPRL